MDGAMAETARKALETFVASQKTQSDAAKMMRVSQPTISDIIEGRDQTSDVGNAP